jgi:diaminopimelate decarboxylase
LELIQSPWFYYKKNHLYCSEVPIWDIIKSTGTPVYIYNKQFFQNSYNEFQEAFKELNNSIFFSVKSNFNISVIKTFLDLGCGADVNSQGEMYRALKAGVKPDKLILSGVGKTKDEIMLGLEHDILMLKAESEEEILLINEIAGKMNKTARVGIRVNPNVDAKTHPYISTGLMENKFGLNTDEAVGLFNMGSKLKNIEFTAIDMHIGSQIISIDPFAEAIDRLSEIYFRLKGNGVKLKHFDIGGGIGVSYKGEKIFSLKEFAAALIPKLKKLDCQILFEPGRFLTANGGILVSQVLFTKMNYDKKFIITDAAMNDLLRPSIYNAYHHIQPVDLYPEREDIDADIVGPVCESGDFFAKDRIIPRMNREEYLAILSCGSYGMVMSSNYNGRRRPPEVLVDNNSFSIIRSRETYEHLIWDEKLNN